MKGRFIYRAWKARLRDQRLEIAIARVLIAPGNLAVDAGANKGAYLYWLRRFTGPGGHVLAYEPQPKLASYLENVCRAFHWSNVEVRPAALSKRAGRAMLHVPGSGVSPGASLESSVLDGAEGQQFECAIATLDEELGGRGALKFLKVDVEGHELALFQGAENTLQRNLPPVLFECEARHLHEHTMQEVFAFLQKLGYAGYLLCGDHLLPLAVFNPAVHQARHEGQFWNDPRYYNNFLFLNGELPRELKRLLRAN